MSEPSPSFTPDDLSHDLDELESLIGNPRPHKGIFFRQLDKTIQERQARIAASGDEEGLEAIEDDYDDGNE